MAGIKIYGSVFSTATMRVLAAAYEKDLEFEYIPVDMRNGAHKQEPFISLNPFGQVPVLVDEADDLTLFESRAITRSIAYHFETKGTQLLPEGNKQMAILSVWGDVEAHQFDPVSTKLCWELFYKNMFKLVTDPAVVEENEAKLAKVLDVYEVRLAKTKYLAGDKFTLVDLHHMPGLHYMMGTQAKKLFEERPHVSAWCKDVLARPSWEKVVAMQKQ